MIPWTKQTHGRSPFSKGSRTEFVTATVHQEEKPQEKLTEQHTVQPSEMPGCLLTGGDAGIGSRQQTKLDREADAAHTPPHQPEH